MVLLAILPAAWAGAGLSAQVEAPPGSVVRWPGEHLTSCSAEGRTWDPLAGACWVPVDLDAVGTVEAESRSANGSVGHLSIRVGDYPYPLQRLTIRDESRVHLSEQDAARAAEERARLLPLFDLETPRLFRLPLSPPLQDLPEGGRFGSRRIINGEPRSPHTGADYAADLGTPVLAVADGTVKLAEEHFFSGNSIFIDHGNGLISMVFHLHEIFVEPGERVTRGAVIGTVGSTGRSTGPHLHFGVRWHGARVDPLVLMEPGRAAEVPPHPPR